MTSGRGRPSGRPRPTAPCPPAVVLAADSPEAALQRARGHCGRIDLLLSEVIMPRLSGRQLYERLRPERPEVRVLFMSGYAGDDLDREGPAMREGRNFLQKPFTMRELARRVREILDEA